jgi:hypothetical protein
MTSQPNVVFKLFINVFILRIKNKRQLSNNIDVIVPTNYI